MVMDEQNYVTRATPVDMTGVRDTGMQALIILAASLGWNVLKKHNTPVVLTARDGTQKRLPTNTSVRMSVFQTALSTIMVHSGEIEPTIELIDEIIKATKPSHDHARRLRLAVGETPAEHRNRINAIAAGVADTERAEGEHLTYHPEITGMTEPEVDVYLVDDPADALNFEPPFDGQEHGELISRESFHAHYSGTSKGTGYTYQSVTSFERIWEDGYKDYECQVCGKVYGSSRAVGSHRQVHTKAGEVKRDERYMTAEYRARRYKRDGRASEVEFVDELPPQNPLDLPPMEVTPGEFGEALPPEITPEVAEDALTLLDAIAKLMQPRLARKYEERQAELIIERDEALKRLAEVEGEFDALVEMLTSRKKPNG